MALRTDIYRRKFGIDDVSDADKQQNGEHVSSIHNEPELFTTVEQGSEQITILRTVVQSDSAPILGIFSIVFGVIGLFFIGFIMSPISLVLSIAALANRQPVTGGIGLVCALVGIVTSPILWLLLAATFA